MNVYNTLDSAPPGIFAWAQAALGVCPLLVVEIFQMEISSEGVVRYRCASVLYGTRYIQQPTSHIICAKYKVLCKGLSRPLRARLRLVVERRMRKKRRVRALHGLWASCQREARNVVLEFWACWGTCGHLPRSCFPYCHVSLLPPHSCLAEKGGGIPRSDYFYVDKHRPLHVTTCHFFFSRSMHLLGPQNRL